MSQVSVVEGKSRPNSGFLSENAERVLAARYLMKDESGEMTETPQELFRRVARAVADVELLYCDDQSNRSEWEDRFYDLMTSRRFMPNSPTLMNAGREMGMLSACFVLPVKDSVSDIFDSIKYTALIQRPAAAPASPSTSFAPRAISSAAAGAPPAAPSRFGGPSARRPTPSSKAPFVAGPTWG